MKKLLSLTFLIIAVFASTTVNAQTSDNATVAASATIVGSLTVTTNGALAFGDILNGDTPTIAATAAGAGSVSVTGATAGQVLNVTIDYPDSLNNASNPNIGFAPVDAATAGAVRTDGTDDPTGASGITSANLTGDQLTGNFTATANTAYIYVGGQIDNSTPGIAGENYSSDITVTVDYN